ncbi:MAG: DegT/DnrJ/EryC1/StrS family aminotransferase [Alphaproteobacteria bacterium]|nr:DegT/DnrJ/EryC1/StrS family aminotransferase [Alphaproteobacteria bacterium]
MTEKQEIGAAIAHVVDRGWFVLGPESEAFEAEFAQYCGTQYCVGLASGTDALTLSLRALGLTKGSRVATVAVAGGYSSMAIEANDLHPTYIDVDQSGQMSAVDLEAAIALDPPSAIIVTYLYGNAGGALEIADIAKRKNIPLIEDCAQAHGALVAGRQVGSLGAIGCFSYYPTKNLGALGDAGGVVTNDGTLFETIKSLRNYGWDQHRYRAERAGATNSRLDDVQAAVLRCRLPQLEGRNERRRHIASRYMVALNDPTRALGRSGGPDDVFHLFVVRCEDRDRAQKIFQDAGVSTGVHYPVPDYRQPRFAERFGPIQPLSETERHCKSVMTIPCFPALDNESIDRVCDALSRKDWR